MRERERAFREKRDQIFAGAQKSRKRKVAAQFPRRSVLYESVQQAVQKGQAVHFNKC